MAYFSNKPPSSSYSIRSASSLSLGSLNLVPKSALSTHTINNIMQAPNEADSTSDDDLFFPAVQIAHPNLKRKIIQRHIDTIEVLSESPSEHSVHTDDSDDLELIDLCQDAEKREHDAHPDLPMDTADRNIHTEPSSRPKRTPLFRVFEVGSDNQEIDPFAPIPAPIRVTSDEEDISAFDPKEVKSDSAEDMMVEHKKRKRQEKKEKKPVSTRTKKKTRSVPKMTHQAKATEQVPVTHSKNQAKWTRNTESLLLEAWENLHTSTHHDIQKNIAQFINDRIRFTNKQVWQKAEELRKKNKRLDSLMKKNKALRERSGTASKRTERRKRKEKKGKKEKKETKEKREEETTSDDEISAFYQ